MSRVLDGIVDRLSNIPDLSGLGDLIEAIRTSYRVDHVYYYAVSLGLEAPVFEDTRGGGMAEADGIWRRDGRSLAAITYSPDWIHHYFEQKYQTVDPVLLGAASSFAPINWNLLDWSSTQRRKFLRDAIAYGVGNQGYTVPIHGPHGQFALFTLNKSCCAREWNDMLEGCATDIMLLAHHVHQQALRLARAEAESVSERTLSAREREALGLIADGLSRGQAADRLGISENTFRVYIDSARHKLGALNIPHAIALAAYRGVITPQ